MRRRIRTALREPSPRMVLVLALAVAAAVLLWESRGQTFFTDEWAFFADYRGLRPEVVLRPDAGNLVAVPVLIYKSLIAVFGGDSYLPFRILWICLDLLCATLFWELARRRIGDWAALAPAILLLFFGAAWEVLGGPLGITILFTGSCGLGTLICLERRDSAGDVGACLLLTLALASYSFGVALAAGAAVEILVLRGREGRRRAWVFLLPLLLYGAWRVWAIQFHETDVTLANLLTLPSSIAASLAAVIASISGTFRPPGIGGIATGPSFESQTGWVLALALLALAAVRVLGRDRRPIDPRAWVLLTVVLVYWVLLGANLGPGRAPESSRYQYLAAVFLLLLGTELVAGLRVTRRAAAGIAAALALCLLGNLGNLHATGNFLRANSDENRAELAAVELARGEVRPGLLIEPLGTTFPPQDDMVISAGDYLSAADDFGSPAYPTAELAARPEGVRERADRELVKALRLAPRPPGVHTGFSVGPLRAEGVESGTLVRRGDCRRLVPGLAHSRAALMVPRGGFSVTVASGPLPTLRLRRFADSFAAGIAAPRPGAPRVVRIPPDAASLPWHLEVSSSVPVTVCPA